MKKRPIFQQLLKRLEEPRKFIQVLLGPRQVGKTTLALQAAETINQPYHYCSADLVTLQNLSWLELEWGTAREMVRGGGSGLLIIDEVQKIPRWSEVIKSLWDEDTRNQINLRVMILGSSPWLIQKGMTESLAGRFEVLPITHWSFHEMNLSFGYSLEQYIYFGGYPGAASLADIHDSGRWMHYINDSLIETTISRDILLMTQVNKPVLLRRLFQLGATYSGQILSYTKMLGELQDAGNTTTLAHYLELLSGAGLIGGIQKYASQKVRQKGSSPKLCVYNTALMSAQTLKSFAEAKDDRAYWGHLVESAVGAYLLNSIRGTSIELFYWREGDREVDFVLRKGVHLIAVEVKSGIGSIRKSALDEFIKSYEPFRVILVGEGGIPLDKFLRISVNELFT